MAAPILKDSAANVIFPMAFGSIAVSVDSVVIEPQGRVPGSAALTSSHMVSAGLVTLTLIGGSDGERYDVSVRVNHAGGGSSERRITVAVFDAAWAMEDGSPGWLTLTEFIAKLGLEETVTATDPDGSGVIDRIFLIGALRDAQAECEANVASRYALPLIHIPSMLKTAVADLARVRLYPRGLPDGADAAARAARANLTRIGSGAMNLPGVGGVAVEQVNNSADGISFTSGGRAYPGGLAEY